MKKDQGRLMVEAFLWGMVALFALLSVWTLASFAYIWDYGYAGDAALRIFKTWLYGSLIILVCAIVAATCGESVNRRNRR